MLTDDPLALLRRARQRYTQAELARLLETTQRTVRRWETRECDPPPYLADALRQRVMPFPQEQSNRQDDTPAFRFIDLFAGIGGLRLAFERHGGQCVFTSEWNPWAQKTYLANFPDAVEHMAGDITAVDAGDIPDHDVLLAGFPCQPFSIAGVSKKNALGRAHGFADETQGTLFFDIQRIVAEKKPAAFLLENVKNLTSHDKGRTFRVIEGVLKELGYHIHCKVLDGRHWVPQHRERILIAGFRDPVDFDWQDVRLPDTRRVLRDILHPQDGSEAAEGHYTIGAKATVDARYTLTPKLWAYLQAYAAKHKAAGNGFGFGLVDGDSVTRTLSARYYKDGSEILLSQGPRRRPRRLTPRECARLMGFPDDFVIPVSDTQAYKQFAQAAVVPMVSAIAKYMVKHLPKRPLMPAIKIHEDAFPHNGNWTEEQTKLAFHFYCQTPFGQLHGRNPKVVELAKLIGRTPSALAMKCCNIASLDPAHQARGVSGLGNASQMDRVIWESFHCDWEGLALECQSMLEALRTQQGNIAVDPQLADAVADVAQDFTGQTRLAMVALRVKQSFFRQSVLSGYHFRCCITGIADSRLLVASHIVPWREEPSIRLHPGNGLCLSALHDKAFDHRLFSLSDDYRIVLSAQLKATKDEALRAAFHPLESQYIQLPERFLPELAFIRRHREAMLAAT